MTELDRETIRKISHFPSCLIRRLTLDCIEEERQFTTSNGAMLMTKFNRGDHVAIPCKVSPGPFDDELLVEFDTLDGKVSGFTQQSNVQAQGEQHFIKGTVLDVSDGILTAMVEGSFFTTNGLANFQPDRVEPMALAA